jgi:CRISP-associated protein Cas1
MLIGRLGLETARVPHGDRHGLLWLYRGNLNVVDGTLHFVAAGSPEMAPGDYAIPFQTVSLILLGPGTTISHDVLRLMARHGTGLAAVGDDGVRLYTAPPLGTDDSKYARAQARSWADIEVGRMHIVRKMYAWRLGEFLPQQEISVMRGIEGARVKEMYSLAARKYGVKWKGRRYDRANPQSDDSPNQAINHSATAVEAAAMIAVAATATIPQLGFIHEDSSHAFCLDIADLYREQITVPVAFQGVKLFERQPDVPLERHVRRLAGRWFKEKALIPAMIDRIKELFDPQGEGEKRKGEDRDGHDGHRHA